MFAKEAKARMDVGRPKEGVANLRQVNQGRASEQAAAVAVEIEPMFAAEAKVRQVQSGGDKRAVVANLRQPVVNQGRASEQAASVVGVSGKMRSRQIHFSHTISNAIQCDCLKLSEHKRKIIYLVNKANTKCF